MWVCAVLFEAFGLSVSRPLRGVVQGFRISCFCCSGAGFIYWRLQRLSVGLGRTGVLALLQVHIVCSNGLREQEFILWAAWGGGGGEFTANLIRRLQIKDQHSSAPPSARAADAATRTEDQQPESRTRLRAKAAERVLYERYLEGPVSVPQGSERSLNLPLVSREWRNGVQL